MKIDDTAFRARYGSWAVVAGASTGLGAEFAAQLAARGLNVVVVARQADRLAELSRRLSATYRVQLRPLPLDLAAPEAPALIAEQTRDLEVGLLIYNAALSIIGPFFEQPLDEIQKRHWPTLKVELLSADERRKLIAEYLAQHAKSLSPVRVERIAAAPAHGGLYIPEP